MFIQEVSIGIQSAADPEEVFQNLDALMGLYRQSGQSGQKRGKLESQYVAGNRIIALPYALEPDSLAARYNNEYVNRQLEQLAALAGQAVQIRCVGTTSPESLSGVCRCGTSPFHVLYTDFSTLHSPVLCRGCNGSVPLYRLQHDGESSFYRLLSWQTNYQACDSLQMNCTVGERWATRQLSDIGSALSKEGRALAAELEGLTGMPVYYYLFNYRAIAAARGRRRPCPACGQPWLRAEALHGHYAFQSLTDRLLSALSTNN